MDKSKFTRDPQLDSEGFDIRTTDPHRYNIEEDRRINAVLREHDINPEGWQEEERPTDFDFSVQAKKALAEYFLNGPVQTFDGEHGTYSDPKCAKCSPWSRIEQRDLATCGKLGGAVR
jgi:hypothetical protein